MANTAPALATRYTATSWADGFGTWHVRIDFPHTLSESDPRPEFNVNAQWARIRRLARSAVVRELAVRRQTRGQSLNQARREVSDNLPTLEVEKWGTFAADNTHYSVTFTEHTAR